MIDISARLRRTARPDEPFYNSLTPRREDSHERPLSPDHVIAQRAGAALQYLDPTLSSVEIAVSDGLVTITGYVKDRKTKYNVEYLVSQIAGVVDIENLLNIRMP